MKRRTLEAEVERLESEVTILRAELAEMRRLISALRALSRARRTTGLEEAQLPDFDAGADPSRIWRAPRS